MRVTFHEISCKGIFRYIDPDTGKKRQVTRKFSQTVNPFNRNSKGEPKTAQEIGVEIKAQRDAWMAKMEAERTK